MTDKPTRKQYMSGEVSFTDFYRAVYQAAAISLKPDSPLISRVRTALTEGDEHLNTIPLKEWDMMAAQNGSRLARAFKAHGDFNTMAGGVCAMKQAARDAAA